MAAVDAAALKAAQENWPRAWFRRRCACPTLKLAAKGHAHSSDPRGHRVVASSVFR